MQYLGDFPIGGSVKFMWNTVGADGASITRSTNGTIRIYKDGGTTERSSANGITDTEDFDSLTGVHYCSIDLSDNTDAGFYARGSSYHVVLAAATIDTKTVNAHLAHFSIERFNLRGLGYGVASGTPSTTSIPTSTLVPAAAVTDQFKGRIVIFDRNTTTANLRGQATDITASTSGGVLTVSALTTAPVSGDTFVIV